MVFVIGSVIFNSSNTESIGKLPCKFYDTIYITDGKNHSNQSITFNEP